MTLEEAVKNNPHEDFVVNPKSKGILKAITRCNGICPCSGNTSEDKHCPCSNYREKKECECKLYIRTYTVEDRNVGKISMIPIETYL